jgi:hypothetical protein
MEVKQLDGIFAHELPLPGEVSQQKILDLIINNGLQPWDISRILQVSNG